MIDEKKISLFYEVLEWNNYFGFGDDASLDFKIMVGWTGVGGTCREDSDLPWIAFFSTLLFVKMEGAFLDEGKGFPSSLSWNNNMKTHEY